MSKSKKSDKTITVEIPVAVGVKNGKVVWESIAGTVPTNEKDRRTHTNRLIREVSGSLKVSDSDPRHIVWVEAKIPIPKAQSKKIKAKAVEIVEELTISSVARKKQKTPTKKTPTKRVSVKK